MSSSKNNGGSSSSQIKGGGRAIMSDSTKQAVIELLMNLRRQRKLRGEEQEETKTETETETSTKEAMSDHTRRREERRFLKGLVEDYERNKLARRYNLRSVSTPEGSSTSTPTPTSASEIDNEKTSSTTKLEDPSEKPKQNKISTSAGAGAGGNEVTGKVRIEFVEAIFKSGPAKESTQKKSKNDKSKGKQKNKNKGHQQDLGFKEGTRKIAVVNRSISMKDLLKQGQSKLNMKKKPERVFVALSKNETMTGKETIFDLDNGLSGVDDGTSIYLSTTPKEDTTMTTSSTVVDDKLTSQRRQADQEPKSSITDTGILEDPLDQVKHAYKQQNRQSSRGNRRRGGGRGGGNNKKRVGVGGGGGGSTSIVPSKEIVEARAYLPAAACKADILSSIRSNLVVVVCGATGSGKSTQVPQFILEDQETTHPQNLDQQISKLTIDGSGSRPSYNRRPYIVVTQPRRVAAISLAQRVSEEVGGGPPGADGSKVGYIVRLDRKVADDSCRIIYCTIGVLLRMLVCPKEENDFPDEEPNPSDDGNSTTCQGLPPLSIDTISHLVLDEVHERDVQTDFCLTLLRGLLPSRPDLRLVLMSATASADTFVNFFAATTNKMAKSIPNSSTRPVVLDIPGRTFPVDIKWLPDCEQFASQRSTQPSIKQQNENFNPNATDDVDVDHDKIVLSPRATEKIDSRFIRSLIFKIVTEQQETGQLKVGKSGQNRSRQTGAILVFMPGKGEIDGLAGCLRDQNGPGILRNNDVCKILKLHSSIPRSDQQAVFKPAKVGTVKIVISSNIAETSVTIPDVSHVIDTGRVKESRFNSQTRIKELVTVWTSQASMNQRAGRAGRTSAGVCWRLIPEIFYNEALINQTAPEMVRTPLDELILQICLMYEQRRDEHTSKQKKAGSGETDSPSKFPVGVRPLQFLSKTPSPPPIKSLVEACRHLLEVDALQVVDMEKTRDNRPDEVSWVFRLTALGYHLSRLPMDSKVGKVLLVGCILGCLDGALTVAAALSCTKSCIISNFGSRIDPSHAHAIRARDALIENGFGGSAWPGGSVKSDLVAIIAAYRSWSKQKGGQKWKFAKSHALDNLALEEIQQLRFQFLDSLKAAGFVSRSQDDNISTFDDCNAASDDALLTSCCLVAGMYPNICTLMRPQKGRMGGRLLTKDGDVCRPSSSSFQASRIKSASMTGKDAYAVYHAKHKSIGTESTANSGGPKRPPDTFLSEVNFVSRFALLLFGGELEIVKNAIIVDGWLKFKVGQESSPSSSSSNTNTATVENAVLIQALREELDRVMSEHIIENCTDGDARDQLLERQKSVLQVVRQLLMEEG